MGLTKWDQASYRAIAMCEQLALRLGRWRRRLGLPDVALLRQRISAPAWLVVLLLAAVARICVDFKPDPCVACAVRGYECLVI